MNISIILNAEQQASLDARVLQWKELNGFSDKTAEDYLLCILNNEIDGYVKADFVASTEKIAALAASKSYEERQSLIETLTQQLS